MLRPWSWICPRCPNIWDSNDCLIDTPNPKQPPPTTSACIHICIRQPFRCQRRADVPQYSSRRKEAHFKFRTPHYALEHICAASPRRLQPCWQRAGVPPAAASPASHALNYTMTTGLVHAVAGRTSAWAGDNSRSGTGGRKPAVADRMSRPENGLQRSMFDVQYSMFSLPLSTLNYLPLARRCGSESSCHPEKPVLKSNSWSPLGHNWTHRLPPLALELAPFYGVPLSRA